MMKGPRAWRVAAIAWTVVVVAFGVLPTHDAVHAVAAGHDDALTSAAHFGEYAVLAFVVAVALGGWRVPWRALCWAGVYAFGLGALIEVVQVPLPYRDGQLSDVVVNAAGAALGVALVSLSGRVRARRSRERRG
jgi:VanZ family protein